MGAPQRSSGCRDTKSFLRSLALSKRSRSVNIAKVHLSGRQSGATLVIGVLLFLACQPLKSVAADESTSSSQLKKSAEIERRFDLTTVKFLSGRCTRELYSRRGAYHYNVKVLLAKLVEEMNLAEEVWEDASDAYDNLDTVYGLAGCVHLSPNDCQLCLSHIITHLDEWCPRHALKAEIVLDTCFLRYDNYYIRFPLEAQNRESKSSVMH